MLSVAQSKSGVLIKCQYYEINFYLIQLPKESMPHYWFMSQRSFIFSITSCVLVLFTKLSKLFTRAIWHIYCSVFCLWCLGLEVSPLVRCQSNFPSFVLVDTYAVFLSVQRRKLIYLWGLLCARKLFWEAIFHSLWGHFLRIPVWK